MNTIKSVYYGWGALIGAGGFAYWLAKRSINADRATKAQSDTEWRKRQDQMRVNERDYREYMLAKSRAGAEYDQLDQEELQQEARVSRVEAARDAEAKLVRRGEIEKSKFEAAEVFKAPRGDRFTTSIWGGSK